MFAAGAALLFTAGTCLSAEETKTLTTLFYGEGYSLNPEAYTEKTIIRFHPSGYISCLESYVKRNNRILLVQRLTLRETPKGLQILMAGEAAEPLLTLGEIHLISSSLAKISLRGREEGEVRILEEPESLRWEISFNGNPWYSFYWSSLIPEGQLNLHPHNGENLKTRNQSLKAQYRSFSIPEEIFYVLRIKSQDLSIQGIRLENNLYHFYQKALDESKIFEILGEPLETSPLIGAINFFILTLGTYGQPLLLLPFTGTGF